MKTISLDCSGEFCGIVTWIDGKYFSHELLTFPKKNSRGRKYIQLLAKLILLDPDEILYEQPIWMHGERYKVLSGMETIIEMYAASMEIPCKSIHNMTLKKAFAGNGKANKEQMRNLANAIGKSFGFQTESFDVADAFAVGYILIERKQNEKM